MKSLQTIQKTFRVFQILTKIAMILSFVWAGLTLIGILCGIVWTSGGIVVGASKEALLTLTLTDHLNQMIGTLLCELVFALTDAALFLFAFRYFQKEQADGTPFTQSGAELIKRLGIRAIVLPLVASILAGVFRGIFDLSSAMVTDQSNLSGITIGIVLILAALIFRYGAELEANKTSL